MNAAEGDGAELATLQPPHNGPFCLTQGPRGSDDGVEHRLQLARRATDDREYFTGGGLVLERLLQLGRARLHLLEQSRILDGDDGLVGKGLEQGDLFGGKVALLLALQREYADLLTLAPKRGGEESSEADQMLLSAARVLGIGQNIRYLHRLALERRTAGDGTARTCWWMRHNEGMLLLGQSVAGHELVVDAPATVNQPDIGVAKVRHGVSQGIENAFEVVRRAAD